MHLSVPYSNFRSKEKKSQEDSPSCKFCAKLDEYRYLTPTPQKRAGKTQQSSFQVKFSVFSNSSFDFVVGRCNPPPDQLQQ